MFDATVNACDFFFKLVWNQNLLTSVNGVVLMEHDQSLFYRFFYIENSTDWGSGDTNWSIHSMASGIRNSLAAAYFERLINIHLLVKYCLSLNNPYSFDVITEVRNLHIVLPSQLRFDNPRMCI